MAGSISLSLSQQFDELGEPLNGGLLYFWAAGTTTPQSAYQDAALTLPYPNPIVLDSAGRIPPFYLADGQIKIRLANAAGVTQVQADNLLVVGASSGVGSPPTVDATTVLATGDFKLRYGTGALSGFVRGNGRTIGSASSGASERANADCQDLFEYLWGADSTLSVSTGRGGSANADWVANKTIALPDCRGRTLAGMDDMGSSASGRLTDAVSGFGDTLGEAGGGQTVTLQTANLPPYTPAGTNTGGAATFTYTSASFQPASTVVHGTSITTSSSSTTVPTVFTNPTFGGTPQGGLSTPTQIVQPTMVITVYLKL